MDNYSQPHFNITINRDRYRTLLSNLGVKWEEEWSLSQLKKTFDEAILTIDLDKQSMTPEDPRSCQAAKPPRPLKNPVEGKSKKRKHSKNDSIAKPITQQASKHHASSSNAGERAEEAMGPVPGSKRKLTVSASSSDALEGVGTKVGGVAEAGQGPEEGKGTAGNTQMKSGRNSKPNPRYVD
jgi:hypothetical protein